MALTAIFFVILEKCSKYGSDHLDRGVFARKVHKKHVFTCFTTCIRYTTGLSNPLACFQPIFLDDQLVFCFQREVSGQISALMLEPSSLSKVAELTCADPEFERFSTQSTWF